MLQQAIVVFSLDTRVEEDKVIQHYTYKLDVMIQLLQQHIVLNGDHKWFSQQQRMDGIL